MKDEKGRILYIGKAKNLKKRVSSYFLKKQEDKTQKLVEKIADIEFVCTDNESEAFLLESNLIKRYRPIYNIELKDQQRYTYLRITDEAYPRLLVARRTRKGTFLGKGTFYGPFTSGSSKLLAIGALRKTFKIRICKRLPQKVCLEYHLGNCDGPCQFIHAREEYAEHVKQLQEVLKGKRGGQDFIAKLRDKMQLAAQLRQYEKAREIRDTLQRLDGLQTKQKMEYAQSADEHYFAIRVENQRAEIMTLKRIHGVIRDRDRFSFDQMADNTFGNFLFQYYTTHPVPKSIIVNELPENQKLLEELFSEQAGFKVQILSPKRGKRREMIDLILKNIDLLLSASTEPGLMELKQILQLKEVPRIIECFDISNHGSDYAVGSMSRFIEGVPDKSGYRKFKIKTVQGPDDFAMIAEIVKRRYMRLVREKANLPDLILIDGGRGQLHAALTSLEALGQSIPCISLAKENEEIFIPNQRESIQIPRRSSSLKILQYARDEAHRFGLTYNRSLRKLYSRSR